MSGTQCSHRYRIETEARADNRFHGICRDCSNTHDWPVDPVGIILRSEALEHGFEEKVRREFSIAKFRESQV